MEQWAQAELQATCSNLGSYDGLKYQIDPDSVECVKDLIRFLRRDGENHEIRRCLGEIQVVQSDLIHILRDHANNRELFDVTLRLLVNLTNPELLLFKEELPEDKETRNFYMQIQNQRHHYKQAFVDKDLWAVLSKTLGALLKKDWDERFEDDKLIIERILILVRNILQVPTNIRAEKRTEGDASLHDQILWVLHQSGMQDLLLYIASSESEINYCLHVLEIISLLFREQDPTSLARANLARSAEEKAADEDALAAARKMEAEKAKVKMKTTPSSRHSRFGGSFVLQNVKSISDRNLIINKPLQGIESVDFDDKKRGRRKAKNTRTPDDGNVARRSTLSVRMFLKEFCTEFLMSAYNQLMNVVKDALNRQKAQQNDETYYLWAMKFFMEFNRGDNFRVSLVTETMSRQTFHYIQQQIDNYRDNFEHEKKNRPKYLMWGRRMHLAIKAYQELLLTLVHMEGSKDSTVKEAGKILMAGVFYEPEYRELCLQQLSTFNPDRMSLGYLTDLVHTTHVFLKLMEHMSKGKHLMVSKKTKVKKPKKKGDESKSGGGGGEGAKRMGREEMWELVSGELSATLQGRGEIPSDVVPFDAASDVPVEDQKEDAMKNLQKALIAKDAGKAVALLRAARAVWPEGDAFGAADSEAEEEFMALREILFADLGNDFEPEQDNNAGQVEEEGEEEMEEEEEEDQGAKFYSVEQEFNYKVFVARFAVKNVITPFGVLFSNYAKNSKSTNHAIIKMFHRAAVECELPALLFQATIFRVFQKVWRDLATNSKDQSLRELAKFAKFILEKFMTLAANNKKMFIELLLWKTSREATEIQEGYGTQAATKKQKANFWIAEDEEKLTTIFQQVREMEAQNPSADMLDTIVSMFEHEGRSRRQIGSKLKELGLIGSIKEISKRPVGVSREWTEEEIEKVVELFNEFKDAENPAARIYEQWKASGLVKRSKGKLVDKIMQLELCDDRAKLGKIKKKNRKPKEGEDGYLTRKSDSDSAMEDSSEGEAESGSESSSDEEEVAEGVGIVEALKKVVEERKGALEWLAGLLEDEAGDREEEDGEDVPILPLTEEAIKAVEDGDFQVVLEQCGLTKPLAGEQYWRIPGPVTAPVLKTRASVIKMAMEGNWEMEGIDQDHLKTSGKVKRKEKKKKKRKKRGGNKWLPFRRDENFVPLSTTSGTAKKSSTSAAKQDSDSEKNDENVDPENKENEPVRKKTANQRKKLGGIDRSRIMRLLNDDSSDEDEANKKDDSTSDEGVDDPTLEVVSKKKMPKKQKEKAPKKPRAKKMSKKAMSNEKKKKLNSSSEEDDDSAMRKEKQINADSSDDGDKDASIKKGKKKNAFESDSSDDGVDDPTEPSESPKTNSSIKKGKKNTFDSDSSSDDGVMDPTQPSEAPIRNDDNTERNKKNSLDSDSDEDVPMVRKSNQKLALDSDSEDDLKTNKSTKINSDSEDEPANQKKATKINSDSDDEPANQKKATKINSDSEDEPANRKKSTNIDSDSEDDVADDKAASKNKSNNAKLATNMRSRSPSIDSRASRSRSRSLDDSRVSRSRSSSLSDDSRTNSPPRYVDATLNDSRTNSPTRYVDATLNDSRFSRSRSRSVSPDAIPAKGVTPIIKAGTVSTPVAGKRSRRSVGTPASQGRKNKKARIDSSRKQSQDSLELKLEETPGKK